MGHSTHEREAVHERYVPFMNGTPFVNHAMKFIRQDHVRRRLVSHFCHGLSEPQAINVLVIKLYAPVKLRAGAPHTTDNLDVTDNKI